jgi:DNA-binding response OmpR family regulator
MTPPTAAAILVVDDDRDACRNLDDILSELGFAVDVAHDGPSALELVRRRPYDVALLDYRMPGMDGLTLCREIRALRPATAALLITAHACAETESRALDLGAHRVLAKPIDPGLLLPHIDRLIRDAPGRPTRATDPR